MGRGRAKAKQTKVARELKYSSPEPDYDKLQQELSDGDSSSRRKSDEEESDDEYARWERFSG